VSSPDGPPGGRAGASGGADPGTGIVDAHHHVWDLSVRDHDWLHEEQVWADEASMARLRRSFTAADLEPLAAVVGVTGTVVVQTDIAPGESSDLLALAAAGGLVGAVVGWVDLTAPGAGDAIAELQEQPGGERLAGIRHPLFGEPDGWLERPEVRRGLAAVASAGLVFDVVGLPAQLPGALAAARALPELTFVLDHLGNPDGEPGDGPWARTMRELAALPNTVVKLSGVLSEAFTPAAGSPADSPAGTPADAPAFSPGAALGTRRIDPLVRGYCEQAMGLFGSARTMFGSDWPPCTLTASYPDVLAAARAVTGVLTEAERAAVFAGTARRIYRLPD
jgi:L-fuconolactonase